MSAGMMFYTLLAAAAVSPATPAERRAFAYGEPCEKLQSLDEYALASLLDPREALHWRVFCRAQDGHWCGDYSDLLLGAGELYSEGAGTGGICRFEPYEAEWEYSDGVGVDQRVGTITTFEQRSN